MSQPRFPLAPLTLASVLVLSSLAAMSLPAHAQAAAAALPISLPAQSLGSALNELARQARLQLMVHPDLVAGKQAPAVAGRLTPRQALDQLLAGSGLVAEMTGVEVIVRRPRLEPGASTETTLAPVTVTAAAERNATSEGTGSYAARASTLFKGAESLKEIPQSVSVITRQRMDDQGLSNVRQALDETPGIYTSSFGSELSGRDSVGQFFSRGYKISNYMVDGVTANAVSGSGQNYNANEALAGNSAVYDRVEVLRGAAGLLTGPGAPGGVVNLVRKLPTAEFQQRYTASIGSWNRHRVEADLSGPLNAAGSLRGRTVLAYEEGDRFWEITNSRSPLAYGVLEADLTPSTTVYAGLRYEKSRLNAPKRSWFWTGDGNLEGYNPGLKALNNPDWGYSNMMDKEVFANLKHVINDDWTLHVAGKHLQQDVDTLSPQTFARPPSGSTYRLYAWDYQTRSTAFDANLVGAFSALGRKHKLLLGASYEEEKFTSRSLNLQYSAVAGLPYDYLTFNPRTSWLRDARVESYLAGYRAKAYDTMDKRNTGVYGKANLSITDDLTAVLGARLSSFAYRVSWNPSANSDVDDEFTPYAGLVYALSPQWSAYGSYTSIFQPQWGNYTRNGGLVDHLQGKNYELGIKGELYDGRLNVAAAIYRVDLDNVITAEDPPFDEFCPGHPRGDGCVRGQGRQRTQGFDVELSGEVLPRWQASVGYSYIQTEVLRANSGEGQEFAVIQGYRMPRHNLKLYSSYRLSGALAGLTLGGGALIQSEQFQNTRKVQGGLAIWNAFARYQFTPNVSAALNINNVFDKRYWPNGVAHIKSMHGTPRSVMLTLQAKF